MSDLGGDVLIVSDPSDDSPSGIYVYDGNRFEVIDRLSTSGLALLPDGRLLRLPRSFDEPGSSGELLVYDRRGVLGYRRLDDFSEAHGIAWQDGLIVAVSTGSNEIVWLDESGEVKRWRAERGGDAWHLNDLFVAGGKLYVSAFGRFSEARGWHGHWDGTGIVFTLERGRPWVVLEGLTAPHTPRLLGDCWLVCNSGTRELLELDAESGRISRRLELRVWPRGIAVRNRLLFVGESENRYQKTDPAAHATVAVVDLDEWKVVERIETPGREIYDLVLAPRATSDGLATGFRTNPLRSRMSAQLGLFEEVGVEPTRLWAVGEPLPLSDLRARIEADVPARIAEHSEVEIGVEVENLGSAIFVSAWPNPIHLSCRWFRDGESAPIADEPLMSPLPRALTPRTPVRGGMRILTPAAGRYRLRLTLVQIGIKWFDEIDPASAFETEVEIVPARADVAIPAAWS
jgi:hypothetical protein